METLYQVEVFFSSAARSLYVDDDDIGRKREQKLAVFKSFSSFLCQVLSASRWERGEKIILLST